MQPAIDDVSSYWVSVLRVRKNANREARSMDWCKHDRSVRARRRTDRSDRRRAGGRGVEIPQLERSMGRDQPDLRRAGRQVRSDEAVWAGATSAADAGVPKDPEESMADQAKGGQGNFLGHAKCIPGVTPSMMSAPAPADIFTPAASYLSVGT